MASPLAMEVRVELYRDGGLPAAMQGQISATLAQRWPETWDVKVPPTPSFEHPAEWRSVVPLPDGTTPEQLHREIASRILGLDPVGGIHLRTRWAFQESPNHQEIYEERWAPNST